MAGEWYDLKIIFRIMEKIQIKIFIMSLLVILLNACEIKHSKFISDYVKKMNYLHNEDVTFILDKNYKEIKIYCKTEKIDTILFHNMLEKINKNEKVNYMIYVHDNNNKLNYVEWQIGNELVRSKEYQW